MKERSVLIAILMCLPVFTLIGIGQNFTARGSAPQLPVNLGSAGNFVILAKSGITNVPTSTITGDIGVSAISSTALTGFALTMDSTNTFATSAQVNGKVYAADYATPTPSMLTTAISDMETAYTNAANAFPPSQSELGAGILGGNIITSGIYKWSTDVTIATSITLSGSASDVWIFQISGNLITTSSSKILLSGGAHASNIFWQVAGYTQLGTDSSFNGIILDQTAIVMQTRAFLNGRAFAQTDVTLDHNIVQMCPIQLPVPEPPIFMTLIAAFAAGAVFIAFKERSKFHS